MDKKGQQGSFVVSDPVDSNALSYVVQAMPLDSSEISVSDISKFFAAYESMLGNSNGSQKQSISSLNSEFGKSLQNINSFLRISMLAFPLNASAGTVATWLRDPMKYQPLINNLQACVNAAFSAIKLFYTNYGKVRSSDGQDLLTPEQKSIIGSQTPIYNDNMMVLQRWLNQTSQVTGFK